MDEGLTTFLLFKKINPDTIACRAEITEEKNPTLNNNTSNLSSNKELKLSLHWECFKQYFTSFLFKVYKRRMKEDIVRPDKKKFLNFRLLNFFRDCTDFF